MMAMRGSKRFGWRTAIVLLAVCAGVWAVNQARSERDGTDSAKIADKMKSVCVGRFLIDVPGAADVRIEGA